MKIAAVAVAALLAVGWVAAPVLAMDKETANAEAQVRALGKRWDGDVLQKTQPLFLPILAKVKRDDLKSQKDIAYGPDPKQKLDVYAPAKTTRPRPVVVYIHGGGMARGDKDEAGTNDLVNSNVAVYFARHGMVGVTINYRLVPGAVYPSGGEDVAGAVTWVRANIKQYGGNPNAVFLIGHSAGGTVLGEYLYDTKVNGGAPEIAGAMFLSGVIELDKTGPRVGVTKAYYGDDQSKWASMDAYTQIDSYKGKRVPTFIINAALDPPEIEEPGGVRHFAKLCALDNACPRYYQAQNMNHLSTSLSLGSGDDSLGREMRDFVRETVGQAPHTARVTSTMR